MLEFLGVLVVAIIVFTVAGLKIVPQSRNFVITRLGAYRRTLEAGVNIIIPFVDRVHSDISIADRVLKDVDLNVISADNAVFDIKLLVVYRINKPELAVFRVNSVDDLIVGLVMSLVRSEIGKVELDTIQQDRASLNRAIKEALTEAGEDYGVIISRSEIIDVRLSDSTERSMAEVLNAERERRATVTKAEGDKKAVELNADAELYEERRRAEALEVMASATAGANRKIAEAVGEDGAAALRYQIAKLQVDALTKLSQSENSKLIMLPGDASNGFVSAASILADAQQRQ